MGKPDEAYTGGQCCLLDEPYQAPPGWFDQPFVYVFDADTLTNGRDYHNLGVTTFSGADFICRRVAGHNRCAVSMQLYDVLKRKFFNTPFNTRFSDFVIAPESIWPAASGIVFDLLNVLKEVKTDGPNTVFLSQIVFQGVRRFAGVRRPPSYNYWTDPYSYVEEITVPAFGAPAERHAFDIEDFDFELLRITETIDGDVPPGFSTAVKLQIFDQVYEKMFSEPVIDDLIVDNSADYQGILAPGTVYRRGQQLKYEVTGLNLPGVSGTVELRFEGVRRRPC